MFDLPHSIGDSFDGQVDRMLAQILEVVTRQEDIYDCLPGLFPGEVAERLRQMIAAGCPVSQRVLSMLEVGDPAIKARVRADLVLPHPLDFEWFFTEDSAVELSCHLLETGVRTVACVGTPSIYQALGQVDPRIERVLADRPGVIGTLRELDGAGSVLRFEERQNATVAADVSVVDSPWYPDQTVRFISMAASLTKVGGQILAVIPPEFTRPGVQLENEAIVEHLESLGLEFVEHRRGAVMYQAPPFEVSTLKALGLYGVSHCWRRGDLLELRVDRPISSKEMTSLGPEESWEELRIHPSRVKFKRCGTTGEVDPSLRSIVAGNVLLSVSRRDPIRSRVAVWTSGNRGFECNSPSVLKVGFEAFMEDRDPVLSCKENLNMALSCHAADQLCGAIDELYRCVQDEAGELEWI